MIRAIASRPNGYDVFLVDVPQQQVVELAAGARSSSQRSRLSRQRTIADRRQMWSKHRLSLSAENRIKHEAASLNHFRPSLVGQVTIQW
jgi:hypothetical protein